MDRMDEDYQYAKGRSPDRLHISKRFAHPKGVGYQRFGHRVLNEDGYVEMVREGEEMVLRETPSGKQQVKAKFLEDNGRRISHLWIQRWNTTTGYPIGEQVVLYGDEIRRLKEFLAGVKMLDIPHDGTFNVDYDDLRLVRAPDAEANRVMESRPDLVAEFARNNITAEDIVALGYRRAQLKVFESMLANPELAEDDWQKFFEQNQWIFGYGLAYVFLTGLDGKSLQETLRGSSRFKPGKIPDGIMKTRAAINALCLVEIKKSGTQLLKQGSYRSGTWAPTAELSGAVAQSQENVRVALDELGVEHRVADGNGYLTGEELYSVQPRSFLVIGNLNEFRGDYGVNGARFRSFEDFRRNIRQPEIITFDELYERAKFIVDSSCGQINETPPQDDENEIPF